MSEDSIAELDDDIVGVVGPVEPRPMPQVHSVRLDSAMAAELRDIANQRGTTVSELLRHGAVMAAEEAKAARIVWLTRPAVTYGPNVTITASLPEHPYRMVYAVCDGNGDMHEMPERFARRLMTSDDGEGLTLWGRWDCGYREWERLS
jgi:hypothetical protein